MCSVRNGEFTESYLNREIHFAARTPSFSFSDKGMCKHPISSKCFIHEKKTANVSNTRLRRLRRLRSLAPGDLRLPVFGRLIFHLFDLLGGPELSSSSWGVPLSIAKNGWYSGKSHLEMDDDWGVSPFWNWRYHYFRKTPCDSGQPGLSFIVWL